MKIYKSKLRDKGGKNVKKITLLIPDGYDQVLSVTAVGVTQQSFTTVTNVTTKVYEIKDNDVYILPIEKENDK